MDLSQYDIKSEFAKFNKDVPTYVAHVGGGNFPFRYYKNKQPKKDVTLVFLAGESGLSDAFFPLYRCFKDSYHMISFYYPKSFSSNERLADAMNELLLQIQAKNIYLIGQSYGGVLAQIVAKRHPETIKGMILSSTYSMSNDLTYEGIASIVKMINPDKLEKNLRFDRKMPKRAILPFLSLSYKRAIKDKDVVMLLENLLKETQSNFTNDYLELMDTLLGDLMNEFGTHYPSDFSSYKNEVMLIFSKEDNLLCDDLKNTLMHLMPNPVVIPHLKGGHFAPMVSHEEYASLIYRFINERNEDYHQ